MYSIVCTVLYVQYCTYVQYCMYSIVYTVLYVQYCLYSIVCTVLFVQYCMCCLYVVCVQCIRNTLDLVYYCGNVPLQVWVESKRI